MADTDTPPEHSSSKAPEKSSQTDSETDPTASPKAKKKAADRKKILVGVAIVGVILTYLVLRSSSSSGAATSTGDGADDTGTSSSDGDTGDYEGDYGGGGDTGSGEDGYGGYGSSILAELQTIATNQTAASGSAGSGGTTTTPGNATTSKLNLGIDQTYSLESKVGSGYNAGGKGAVVSTTGNLYDFVSNFVKGGTTSGLYVQTSEGHFTEASNVKNLEAGTPLYKFNSKVATTAPAPKKS